MYLNPATRKRLTLVVVALVSMSNCIRCAPTDQTMNLDVDGFSDIIDAVNFVYEALVGAMPLKQRCERYAVLLSLLEMDLPPFGLSVKRLFEQSESVLKIEFNSIELERYIALYMTAIDRYRTSKLAPGFIDLIDCLRQVDIPAVKRYFSDGELQIIEQWYRQVIVNSDLKINLENFKAPQFDRFKRTLKLLFKDNIQEDRSQEVLMAGASIAENRPSGKQQQAEGVSRQEQSQGQLYQSHEQFKQLTRRPREEQHWNRERDRLRKRRRRILEPEWVRERERIGKQRRRNQLAEAEGRKLKQRESYRKRQRDAESLTYGQTNLPLQIPQHGAQAQNQGDLERDQTNLHQPELTMQWLPQVAPAFESNSQHLQLLEHSIESMQFDNVALHKTDNMFAFAPPDVSSSTHRQQLHSVHGPSTFATQYQVPPSSPIEQMQTQDEQRPYLELFPLSPDSSKLRSKSHTFRDHD